MFSVGRVGSDPWVIGSKKKLEKVAEAKTGELKPQNDAAGCSVGSWDQWFVNGL